MRPPAAGQGMPCAREKPLILHADTIPDGEIVQADVCIVGGGAVGLQMARRLIAAGMQVVIAESGEEEASQRAQDLNIGTQSGRNAGGLRDIRLRQLGGTMHLWGGNCRPLDPIDFRPRDWVPNSGWPLSYADMAPYFEAAHGLLRLEEFTYWPEAPSLVTDPGPAQPFEETLFRLTRFVPGTRAPFLGEFSQYHAEELRNSDRLRILVGANVSQIFLTEDRRSVRELYALTFQGRELHLRAKAYVFACGGIETARLLLASREDMPTGIGNQGDSLGRYFMEHPHGLAAFMIAEKSQVPALRPFSPGIRVGDAVIHRRIRLADHTQRELGLLNMIFQLIAVNMKPHEQNQYEPHFRALEATVEDAANWQRYYVVFLAEQFPSRDSRVTLGAETDFFGMPRADLNWQVGDLDFKTVSTALSLLGEHVFTAPHFRMKGHIARTTKDWLVGHGAHHLGTTRMSLTPKEGVVDRDCRIHGLSNGFCAGSSVFPTAGMSNPMLTSLAIGLRLARHLESNLPFMPAPDAKQAPRRPREFEESATAAMA